LNEGYNESPKAELASQTTTMTTTSSSSATTGTTTTIVMDAGQANVSRQITLRELEKLGVDVKLFESLGVDQLFGLLIRLREAMAVAEKRASSSSSTRPGTLYRNARKDGRINGGGGGSSSDNNNIGGSSASTGLSLIDKKILKALLESKGNPSSLQLSRELDIPLSTVQRRRKRLEDEFVKESYSLCYEKFGKRRITFIISLGTGEKSKVVREILAIDKVLALTRTFGDSVDLKVEAILETNQEFIDTCEKIKSVPGVQKVSWFESIEMLGTKKELDLSIIGSE
jgi:DNA-binding Lrp family transcriptional regulator